MTPDPQGPLHRLWLVEAVRLVEASSGALDDAEASRRARAQGGTLEDRIIARALWLAQMHGLVDALQRWRAGARWAGLALAGLACLTGFGLAVGALGDGTRPVNLLWALGSLLGLNLLSLCAWLLMLRWRGGDGGGALGRLWLWLTGRFTRDLHAGVLGHALLSLLRRGGLGRWGPGTVIHGLWLLAMSVALVTLVIMMSLRNYGFVWETTLLADDQIVAATRLLGAVPAWLGFHRPDEAMIRASGEAALADPATRRLWATWLLGAVLVYGALPRAVLLLWCLWRWLRGLRGLTLDAGLPGHALLRERLMPTHERLGVTDPAGAPGTEGDAVRAPVGGQGAVLVAVELDDSHRWPPPLPPGVRDAGVIDDGAQRRRLLEDLTQHPPARLAIACDPRRSPDRGTLALLSELARCAGATRVWLRAAPDTPPADPARRADWQQALARLKLPYGDDAPLAWLETGHG